MRIDLEVKTKGLGAGGSATAEIGWGKKWIIPPVENGRLSCVLPDDASYFILSMEMQGAPFGSVDVRMWHEGGAEILPSFHYEIEAHEGGHRITVDQDQKL